MPPKVICAGLSCLDMQLVDTTPPPTLETVTPFSHTTFTPGGSAPQTALALCALGVHAAALTHVGDDAHAATMRKLLRDAGVDTSTVLQTPGHTSLAVLPLLTDGRRACFVSLACNLSARHDTLLTDSVVEKCLTETLRVFHFGYPHLMPHLQGMQLRALFDSVREHAPRVLLTMDVNGADVQETSAHPVLLPALEITAAIHANLEEACVITGLAPSSDAPHLSAAQIKPIVEWFTTNGAGIAAVTCGKDGVFLSTRDAHAHLRLSPDLERAAFLYRRAYSVSDGVQVNASGAGDAFVAGILSELAENAGNLGLVHLADAGLVSALHRIDNTLVEGNSDIPTLLKLVEERPRVPPSPALQPDKYSSL